MIGIDGKKDWDIVVVGGGIAGFAAAEAATRHRPDAAVLILSDEDRLPYRRTKISKNIAEGFSGNQLAIEDGDWYQERHIKLQLGARVSSLDPNGRSLKLQNGDILTWNRLVIATGAEPVLPAPAAEISGDPMILVFRQAVDAEALIEAIPSVGSVLIVGAGVLGVEVTEQVKKTGLDVTLIDNGPGPIHRELSSAASERLKALIHANGVDTRFGTRVEAIRGTGSGGFSVPLPGETLETGLIVFCVGTTPRTDLAAQAGLEVERGIKVDRYLRTSDPNVSAVGDVAQHPNGQVTYLWHAAELQGELAGMNAGGQKSQYDNPPFRMRCEVWGHYYFEISHHGAEQSTDILERDADEIYQQFHFKDGRCSAAVMIDDKPRAELYTQSVLEGWSRSRVEEDIKL